MSRLHNLEIQIANDKVIEFCEGRCRSDGIIVEQVQGSRRWEILLRAQIADRQGTRLEWKGRLVPSIRGRGDWPRIYFRATLPLVGLIILLTIVFLFSSCNYFVFSFFYFFHFHILFKSFIFFNFYIAFSFFPIFSLLLLHVFFCVFIFCSFLSFSHLFMESRRGDGPRRINFGAGGIQVDHVCHPYGLQAF